MESKDAHKRILEDTIARVDPKHEYNLTHMTRDQLFPWVRDRRSYRKAILTDSAGPNILQANIMGDGKGADYKIKGACIKKYLKTLGYAMLLQAFDHVEASNIAYDREKNKHQTGSRTSKKRSVRKDSNQKRR